MSNNVSPVQPTAIIQPGAAVQPRLPVLMLPRPASDEAHLTLTASLQEQYGEEYRITEGICYKTIAPPMWYLDPKTMTAQRIPARQVTVVMPSLVKTEEPKYPTCNKFCCQNKPYDRSMFK